MLVAVRFSEPVTVTGMPQLALAVGSDPRGRVRLLRAGVRALPLYGAAASRLLELTIGSDTAAAAAEGITLNGGTIVDGRTTPS